MTRSLPLTRPHGPPVHVAVSQTAPFSTSLRFGRNDKISWSNRAVAHWLFAHRSCNDVLPRAGACACNRRQLDSAHRRSGSGAMPIRISPRNYCGLEVVWPGVGRRTRPGRSVCAVCTKRAARDLFGCVGIIARRRFHLPLPMFAKRCVRSGGGAARRKRGTRLSGHMSTGRCGGGRAGRYFSRIAGGTPATTTRTSWNPLAVSCARR